MNLESLISAQLDGVITPEQHAQLEGLLRHDWQARRIYLEMADQHSRLLQQMELNAGRMDAAVTPQRRWLQVATFFVPLAVTLLGVALWPRGSVIEEGTADGVATLSTTLDAQFADGSSLRSGDTLAPGIVRLKKGLAQVEFFSGASALVEGDAEIEIISAWEARCLRGRVRLHVPPAAKGFVMHAPDVKLEDLGTEFALNVRDGASRVHVFDGEVIAHTSDRAPSSLTRGMSFASRSDEPAVSPEEFLAISDLTAQTSQIKASRHAAWRKWAGSQQADPRLVARYLFERHPDDRWDRLVANDAEPQQRSRAGGAVGARWTEGRWPGKQALEFKRPGDRVRLLIDGHFTAITFACWVKVDSVDKNYNALLLTDGYDNGEPHWQIYEDGSLMFSITYRPDGVASGGSWNQKYFSKPVFRADSLGRWHHIAVSYDSQSGEVVHYFDGHEVGREVSKLHRPGRAIVFGPCELGNWGLPTTGHQFPIRNLNGAIDEFAIYSSVLGPAEVRSIYEPGRAE